MKKILCFILSVILVMVCMTGCDNRENEKPTVTINIKLPVIAVNEVVDSEVRDVYSFMRKAADDFCSKYQDADVNINIQQYETGKEDEEIVDRFDTDEAADIMFDNYLDMSTYIYSGRVVPLDDIITDEMKNDIKPVFWELSQVDGKTYMMPFFTSQDTLCYNKDLFHNAGLDEFVSSEDVVQSWTLDEWNIILEKLRESLPDTSYPMMMYAGNEDGVMHIMTLLRSHGCEVFNDEGYLCVNTPEGIEALKWLKECDEKNYFPHNAETLVMLDNYSMFVNGQLGFYVLNSAYIPDVQKADFELGYVNFPSADGRGYSNSYIAGFEVFDNGDEEKLRVSKDFIKYIYESDWLDYSAERIPISHKVAEKYADKLKDITKYINNSDTSATFTRNKPNWKGVRNRFYKLIQHLLYGDMSVEEIASSLDTECNKEIENGIKNASLHK